MKKLFLGTFITFCIGAIAQEYKYEPVSNKAEYYISKFKGFSSYADYRQWGMDAIEITNQTNKFENMEIVLFTPLYNSDMSRHDVIWLSLWPNATAQFAALEWWVKNGSSHMSKLPVENVQVIDTWQWPISSPEGEMDIGAVRFSRCKLKDNITPRTAFDAYKDFAAAAKEQGDNLGRKMIFPASGGTEGDYDFVYSLYARNVAELGAAADNYWENINGSDADLALGEVIEGCSNYSTYTTDKIK